MTTVPNFRAFWRGFPPAAALAYLARRRATGMGGESRTACQRMCRALDLAQLAGLDEAALSRVRFAAHPGLSLLRLVIPADAIWRAVLDQDDGRDGGDRSAQRLRCTC